MVIERGRLWLRLWAPPSPVLRLLFGSIAACDLDLAPPNQGAASPTGGSPSTGGTPVTTDGGGGATMMGTGGPNAPDGGGVPTTGGAASQGGSGGSGGSAPIGPCYNGNALSDDFDGGAQLSWETMNVAFRADYAVFTPSGADAVLVLTTAGVLKDCYFEIAIPGATNVSWIVQWAVVGDTISIGGGNNTTFSIKVTPVGDVTLLDSSPLVEGIVRLSEEDGRVSIETATSPDANRILRYEMTTPTFLDGIGKFRIVAMTGGGELVVDNFNPLL